VARPGFRIVAAAWLAASIAPPALAESTDWTQSSTFAVLTHKGGFAAGKAHDHLVAAGSPTITLEWDASDPLATRFELRAQVASLRVDEDPLRAELFPRLRDLGLLQQPFGPLTEAQRAEIREAMLSKKQLDAAAFSELSARLVEVSESASKLGTVDFTHRGTVELTVHGTTIRRPFQARFDPAAGSRAAILEAVGEATFTELGIKPYSAFLGAVKNLDRFHFYLRLELESGAD
jgi:hypothetical protein